MAAPVKLIIGELVPAYRVQLLDGYGNPVDLTGATVKFQFRAKESSTYLIDSSANVTVNIATDGDVQYDWQAGDTATGGIYQARWHVTFSDNSVLIYPSDVGDSILITSGPNLGYNIGPCTPWTTVEAVSACCTAVDNEVASDVVQEQIDVASDALWALSGRVFSGECLTAIRPQTGHSCFGRYTNGWYVANAYASYGFMYGRPDWSCDCHHGSRLRLGHYPVTNIVTVTIDGTILDPAEYRLDAGRWLTRLDGGTWPSCQRLDLPPTDIGTFEVLMEHGTTVPPLGVQAARDLACELTKQCGGGPCSLPANATSAVRQGVAISLDAKNDISTNIPSVALFLQAHNPNKIQRRPTVLSPDFP